GYSLPTPISANVKLIGHVGKSGLTPFLADSRMLVSASECYETFGMSVAEASLHQRPVVVSRIGVFPEFVVEGKTGLLFEPGNATQLADRIRELWQSPSRCREMGQAGRERALREYSRQTYYDRISNVFKAVLAERNAWRRAS